MVYNGTRWSAPRFIDRAANLASVSCPSARFCAAIDTSGNVFTFNGRKWTKRLHIPTEGLGLQSISCPQNAQCVISGGNGKIYAYAGSRLTVSDRTRPQRRIQGLSCPTIRFCAVVTSEGFGFTGS
jgi:hypothetical protein